MELIFLPVECNAIVYFSFLFYFSVFFYFYLFKKAVVSALAPLSCPQLSVNYCRAVLAYCGKQ